VSPPSSGDNVTTLQSNSLPPTSSRVDDDDGANGFLCNISTHLPDYMAPLARTIIPIAITIRTSGPWTDFILKWTLSQRKVQKMFVWLQVP